MKFALITFISLLSSMVVASDKPLDCRDAAWKIKTAHGLLKSISCDAAPHSPQKWLTKWYLNDKELLWGYGSLGFEARNDEKSLIVLSDFNDPTLSCPARMFLIDLTGIQPRVFAFGVKNACAEYHWASWGKKRSVIAIKENIRFTYSNGKLTPPPADFGDGIPLLRRYPEDAQSQRNWPFVEELQIP